MQKSWIIGSLVAVGLILGASSATVAQMPHDQMQSAATSRRIDQPLWLKGTVTVGGIGLIGIELWWFLFSKSKSRKADT